ncbi:MAG: WecB/TagA/CpsF family glycosyltransferase [Pseudomonadota bacterium]
MGDPFTRKAWSVFGIPIDAVTLDEAERRVRHAAETREQLSFVTPNLNWVMRAIREPEAMAQIQEADLSLADGAPVAWLARQLGAPVESRVAGSDLFDRLRVQKAGRKPLRVFFFGGRAGAADAAMEALNREGGGLIGCGALNPGYGPVEDMGAPVILDTINRARPDFLVVSLGAEKGQTWISKYQARVDAPIIAHLGAVVDFVAGTKKRAPAWMQRAGLEWAWRIGAEPSLWRRYLADGARFAGVVPTRLWVTQRDYLYLKSQGCLSIKGAPTDRGFDIKLDGDALEAHSDLLSPVLERALEAGGDVNIDAEGLGSFDGSFLAKLSLLKRRLRAGRRHLCISGLSAPQTDILSRMDLAAEVDAGLNRGLDLRAAQ